MTLRPKFPASWHPGRQSRHQSMESLHQQIRAPTPARVLHQPPMLALLDVPEDFTREVRRRLDSMDPTVEPEPQREPSATPRDGLREEFVSEVRRRLDRADRVSLYVLTKPGCRAPQCDQRATCGRAAAIAA